MWDFLDEIADDVGEAVHDVGHAVGGTIDQAAHVVGAGLDKMGLHSAADAVDGLGDTVADKLGAHADELPLGQTDDPAKLVHGDVGAITTTAQHLAHFAAAFHQTADGLHRIDTAHWTGAAADAFRARYNQHPAQWADAASACQKAAATLTSYGAVVKVSQEQAAQAVKLYEQAKQASAQAFAEHVLQVDTYNKQADWFNQILGTGRNPGPPPQQPGEFQDPGVETAKQAQTLLTNARTSRNNEGERAQAAVAAALEKAPAEPGFLDRLGNEFGDLTTEAADTVVHYEAGIMKGVGGILKFGRTLNPLDPYNLTHPAEFISGVSGTVTGLLHAANHPVDVVKGLFGDGWGSDPAEAFGKLIPNIALGVTTDGAGEAAAVGERAAVGVGEDAAEQAGMSVAKDAAETSAADSGVSAVPRPAPPEPPAVPASDFDPGLTDHDFSSGDHTFGPEGTPEEAPAPEPLPESHLPSRHETNWDSYEHDNPLDPAPHPAHPESSDISTRLGGDPPPRPHDVQPDQGNIGKALDGDPAPDHGTPPGDHGGHQHDTGLAHDHHGHDDPAPHHEPHDPTHHEPGDPAHDSDHSPYTADHHFRSTEADRSAFRDDYSKYERHAATIQRIVEQHPEYGGIPEGDLVGIRGYTTSDYYQGVNSALRDGDQEAIGQFDSHIRTATSGLNQLPTYQGTVQRGIQFDSLDLAGQVADKYLPGRVIEEPAFVSTDTARSFPGQVQFEIYSSQGRLIRDLSENSLEESEVLYPPGSKFKVIKKSFDENTQTWHIAMADVP